MPDDLSVTRPTVLKNSVKEYLLTYFIIIYLPIKHFKQMQ